MTHKELVELMSKTLIEMNQSANNLLTHPEVWQRVDGDADEPIRKFYWKNDKNALIEMSIWDNKDIEFEVVAGDDEELFVLIGDVPSEVYGWDVFPRVILNSFCKP